MEWRLATLSRRHRKGFSAATRSYLPLTFLAQALDLRLGTT